MSVWEKIEELARKRKQCVINLEKLDNALTNNEISKETYLLLSESLKKEIENYDRKIEQLLDSVARDIYKKLFDSYIDPEIQAYKKILEKFEELAKEKRYLSKRIEEIKLEYESKLDRLRTEFEKEKKENEDLQRKVAELKNQNLLLEKTLEKEKEKNETLKRSINELLKQIDDLLKKNDELSRIIDEARRIRRNYEELKAIIELEKAKKRMMQTSNIENSGDE